MNQSEAELALRGILALIAENERLRQSLPMVEAGNRHLQEELGKAAEELCRAKLEIGRLQARPARKSKG